MVPDNRELMSWRRVEIVEATPSRHASRVHRGAREAQRDPRSEQFRKASFLHRSPAHAHGRFEMVTAACSSRYV